MRVRSGLAVPYGGQSAARLRKEVTTGPTGHLKRGQPGLKLLFVNGLGSGLPAKKRPPDIGQAREWSGMGRPVMATGRPAAQKPIDALTHGHPLETDTQRPPVALSALPGAFTSGMW